MMGSRAVSSVLHFAMPHDNSSYRRPLPPEAIAYLERPMPRPLGFTTHAARRAAERLPRYFTSPEHAVSILTPLLPFAEPNPYQHVTAPGGAAWTIIYRRHAVGLLVTDTPNQPGRNIITVMPRILVAGDPPLHERYVWCHSTQRFTFRDELRRSKSNARRVHHRPTGYSYDGRAGAAHD